MGKQIQTGGVHKTKSCQRLPNKGFQREKRLNTLLCERKAMVLCILRSTKGRHCGSLRPDLQARQEPPQAWRRSLPQRLVERALPSV